ncbi:hypothetical protein FV241_11945 [Methylobacterium sp. WL2]|nr:hypothetical protein FVA80_24205 [Methylobacterium sp. WL1]TXN57221.1 hypothetical protein FV241_11945 [Methylobacterium sp. WL2]
MGMRDPSSDRGGVDERVLDDLQRRFTGFEAPAQPIIPADIDASRLREFGLPPRPGSAAPRILHQVWERGFGRSLALKSFALDPMVRERIKTTAYRISAKRANRLSPAASPLDTSRNWAGAYLTANGGQQFAQVWGVWKTPETLRVPDPPNPGTPGFPYVCSHWIGLDGQRRYLDASLPQVGTVSLLKADGAVTAEAWTQWWTLDAAHNAPTYLPLPLAPGNEVLCVLTAIDARRVVAVVVNLSTSPPVGIAVQYVPQTVDIDGQMISPKITGATAEWIVERPSVVGSSDIYNFPNYGTAAFDLCVAVESPAEDFPALSSGVPQVLHGTRYIRMLERKRDPARIAVLSLAKGCSPTSLKVTYGGLR